MCRRLLPFRCRPCSALYGTAMLRPTSTPNLTAPSSPCANVSRHPACPRRWVPADPLTGFVDRPRDVEANLPKERQPVAYAIALAGGGAKDVTSRWVLCRGTRQLWTARRAGCRDEQLRCVAWLLASR